MKKTLFFLSFVWIVGIAYAQEFSSNFTKFQKKVVACINNAQSDRQDVIDLEQCCQKIVDDNNPLEAPRACMFIGELYRTMSNRSLNDGQKSLNYYRNALQLTQNDTTVISKSLYSIGLLYYNNTKGIEQNFDSAYYYFSEAAAYDAFYLVSLGTLYQFGFGVDQDISRAISYFVAAISRGNSCYSDLYSADYMLKHYNQGTLYSKAYDDYITYFTNANMNGDGRVALAALQKSADSGYVPAMLDLAILYTQGKISPNRNVMIERAHYYLEQPAMKDYPPALYMDGYVYECALSNVNDPNIKKMFRNYKASAELGYAPGQLSAGLCYLRGYGTHQDLDKAEQMILMSIDQNNATAVKNQQAYFNEIDNARHVASVKKEARRNKLLTTINIICGVANIAAQTYSAVAAQQHPTTRHYTTSANVVSSNTRSSVVNTQHKSAANHSGDPLYCKYERATIGHWVKDKAEIKSEKIYIYKQNKTGKLYASFVAPNEYGYIIRTACEPVNNGWDKETGFNHNKNFNSMGIQHWFD